MPFILAIYEQVNKGSKKYYRVSDGDRNFEVEAAIIKHYYPRKLADFNKGGDGMEIDEVPEVKQPKKTPPKRRVSSSEEEMSEDDCI